MELRISRLLTNLQKMHEAVIGHDAAAWMCPHCGYPLRPLKGSWSLLAWHHGLRHAVKAFVVFPLIYLAVYFLASPLGTLSGIVKLGAIPCVLNVAMFGGAVAGLAVLVAAGIRRVRVRDSERVDRWKWSRGTVRAATLAYALVVFWNVILSRV